MRRLPVLLGFVCAAIVLLSAVIPPNAAGNDVAQEVNAKKKKKKKDTKETPFMTEFPLEKDELTTTGRNDFFILEPGYFLILENGKEKFVMTVLNETKKIGDIETRVVEEKETKDGKLVEFSRNYFAISKTTKNVYYFGEDVDIYKNDKIVGHKGTWLHGVKDAKFGMMMPGKATVGQKYYQEQAPGAGMDRAEHLSVTETIEVPAGKFTNCLKVKETTPLEPDNIEHKWYASGVGLISDGTLKLTKYGFLKDSK
jgi:hypothetical protein